MPRPVCLVCEDEILVGLDVEACLDDLGIAVAGPFTHCNDAMNWIEAHVPNVAILDYLLPDGDCRPLVQALRERHVPIIIHSAWFDCGAAMPPEIDHLPCVSKPLEPGDLAKELAKAVPEFLAR